MMVDNLPYERTLQALVDVELELVVVSNGLEPSRCQLGAPRELRTDDDVLKESNVAHGDCRPRYRQLLRLDLAHEADRERRNVRGA